MLDDAYEAMKDNPLWRLMQAECASQARFGRMMLSRPDISGERLKVMQGEVMTWDEIPGLLERIYLDEESQIDSHPVSPMPEQAPGS